jgi:hypothetical protein
MRVPEHRLLGQQDFVPRFLDPETSRRHRVLTTRRKIAAVGNREERNAAQLHALEVRLGVECEVEDEVARLMGNQADRCAGEKLHHVRRVIRLRLRFGSRGLLRSRRLREREHGQAGDHPSAQPCGTSVAT